MVTEDRKCQFCKDDVSATFRIEGWVEEGYDCGYVYYFVCDEHIKSFEEWYDEDDFHEPDDRIRGLEYIEEIIPLHKPNSSSTRPAIAADRDGDEPEVNQSNQSHEANLQAG